MSEIFGANVWVNCHKVKLLLQADLQRRSLDPWVVYASNNTASVMSEQANRKCHTASNGCRVLLRMAFPSRRQRTVHKNYYLTQIVAFTRTVARVGRVARMARNEIGWLTMWTVLLRSWPGSVSLHPRLLPDRATSLSEGRMRRRLRRGAGVLRHTSGCYCRLLLRRISRQKTRQSRTTGWWSAGM